MFSIVNFSYSIIKLIEINKEDFSIAVPKELLTHCKERG